MVRKYILSILALFLIFHTSFAGLKAYNFELETLDGKKVKLSDFKGNVVVLIFWSTKCPVCKKEMPKLWKWYKEKYQNKPVKFLAIVINTKDKKKIKKAIQEWGFGFTVLIPDDKTLSKYFVPGTPTFYILRKDLTVGKILFGEQKIKVFEKLINRFLKENR